MDEFDLIRRYFAPLSRDYTGGLNLTDDAAIFSAPDGFDTVITKDAISEGVHFLGDEDPAWIAQKLLRVNLSDLAAMGASPHIYFLALMLPTTTQEAWIKRFAEGLQLDQEKYRITLAGGDTTATHGTLSCSLTALGLVKKNSVLKRSGAKTGDHVFVSGTLGDSAMGLALLEGKISGVNNHDAAWLQQRYYLPEPQLALGQKLQGIASACIDVSDGLVQDLGHIARASGLRAVIQAQHLPVSGAAWRIIERAPQHGVKVLSGGDDYELLFTVPPDKAAQVPVDCNYIGIMEQGSGVVVLDERNEPMKLEKSGFRHFA